MLIFKRIREALAFFGAYALDITRVVLVLCLPLLAVETALVFLAVDENTTAAVVFAQIIAQYLYRPVYQAGLIHLLHTKVTGEPFSMKNTLTLVSGSWVRLLAVNVVRDACFVLGFFLLVVPGILAISRLCLAQFHVVLENRAPRESLIRSYAETRVFMWEIAGSMTALAVLLLSLKVAADQAFVTLGIKSLAAGVVQLTVSLVLTSLFTILYFRFHGLAAQGQNQGPPPFQQEDF